MIPIKNIYYMLAYVFQVLNEKSYKRLETEEFENIMELFAEMLIISLSTQVKRGLEKDYIEKTEKLPTVQGKVDITSTIRTFKTDKKITCEYDEFTTNTYKNQIIKSTIFLLFRSDIEKRRKNQLKNLLLYFKEVNLINLKAINWNINHDKNNQTYILIITICQLISKGLLQKESPGKTKIIDIYEENLPKLYEKFILEYYKKEYPHLKPSSSQIKWQLDDEIDTKLPTMQTDVTLTNEYQTLIIDAKYYTNTMQEHYKIKKIHSRNLYQIFTYVKNKEIEESYKSHKVSGMLLYAKTDEKEQPNYTYKMSGNKISVQTLDLNVSFDKIKEQLNKIIENHFL